MGTLTKMDRNTLDYLNMLVCIWDPNDGNFVDDVGIHITKNNKNTLNLWEESLLGNIINGVFIFKDLKYPIMLSKRFFTFNTVLLGNFKILASSRIKCVTIDDILVYTEEHVKHWEIRKCDYNESILELTPHY
jgi:hypothetical protein